MTTYRIVLVENGHKSNYGGNYSFNQAKKVLWVLYECSKRKERYTPDINNLRLKLDGSEVNGYYMLEN